MNKKGFMKSRIIFLLIFLIVLFGISGEEKTVIKNSGKQEYIHSLGFIAGVRNRYQLQLETNSSTPFEMIGWSKDGLFAYRYIQNEENIHFSNKERAYLPVEISKTYTLIIFNAITNKIVERERLLVGDDYLGIYGGSAVSILYDERLRNRTLNEYKVMWNLLLEKHSIIGKIDSPFSSDFKNDLTEFPINNYSCTFDYIIEHPNNMFPRVESFIEWKLIIGNDVVKKIIIENNEKIERFEGFITGRKILGYYKSPYENRIVVVVNYYNYRPHSLGGWLTGTLNLFGYNLDEIGLGQ